MSTQTDEDNTRSGSATAGVTPRAILVSNIRWFGEDAALVCDGKCEKAWGINARPRIEFDSEDPDDIAYLADGELEEAPRDPGTYEGGHGKPTNYDDDERHNKWCARECERSCIVDGRDGNEVELPTFDERRYNQPWKHEEHEG